MSVKQHQTFVSIAAVTNSLPSGNCSLCQKKIKVGEAVLVFRDLSNRWMERSDTGDVVLNGHLYWHRRCIESLLSKSVEDAPIEATKFEKYRSKLADQMGIPLASA